MAMHGGGIVDPRRETDNNNRLGYVRELAMKRKNTTTMTTKKKKKKVRKQHKNIVPGGHHMENIATTAIQELFDSCKHVFKGPATVPSPSHVQNLCRILDKMKPEDVGLRTNLHFFKAIATGKGTPRVTTTTIYQSDKFSLCMFFLPATAVIPLHNHPGMTVFSKLLVGTMHIKSYDWVSPPNSDPSQLRLGMLKSNSVFTAPCDTSVLYPTTGGNIHAFTAITPCAVLDVLGPPYSSKDGRDCSFYKEFPYSKFSTDDEEARVGEEEGESYGWLQEIDVPENSEMDLIKYLGPQIIDTN